MVKRIALAAVLPLVAAFPASAGEIDLAAWAAALPQQFSVAGAKVEPTYMAAIEIMRDGDTVSVLGGAPAWAERARETVEVGADGAMAHTVCPPGMDCSAVPRPAGFLATASLIAAARRHALQGAATPEAFGRFTVVCIDAATLGIARPILDPCFEIGSGAAIAQKHRESGRFDGPSLDPVTVRIDLKSPPIPSSNPKDKAS